MAAGSDAVATEAEHTCRVLSAVVAIPPGIAPVLRRPPFKLIHDILKLLIAHRGFAPGLFCSAELDTELIRSRYGKPAKMLVVSKLLLALKQSPDIEPSRLPSAKDVIGGKQPLCVNYMLQSCVSVATMWTSPSDWAPIVTAVLAATISERSAVFGEEHAAAAAGKPAFAPSNERPATPPRGPRCAAPSKSSASAAGSRPPSSRVQRIAALMAQSPGSRDARPTSAMPRLRDHSAQPVSGTATQSGPANKRGADSMTVIESAGAMAALGLAAVPRSSRHGKRTVPSAVRPAASPPTAAAEPPAAAGSGLQISSSAAYSAFLAGVLPTAALAERRRPASALPRPVTARTAARLARAPRWAEGAASGITGAGSASLAAAAAEAALVSRPTAAARLGARSAGGQSPPTRPGSALPRMGRPRSLLGTSVDVDGAAAVVAAAESADPLMRAMAGRRRRAGDALLVAAENGDVQTLCRGLGVPLAGTTMRSLLQRQWRLSWGDRRDPLTGAAGEAGEEGGQAGFRVSANAPRGLDGHTALHYACRRGRALAAGVLLAAGAAPGAAAVSHSGSGGRETPLHLAAEAGSLACVILLLAHGAPVDAQSEDGATPLHVAAQGGSDAVALELICAGASPAVRDRFGDTPLDVATAPRAAPASIAAASLSRLQAALACGTPARVSSTPHLPTLRTLPAPLALRVLAFCTARDLASVACTCSRFCSIMSSELGPPLRGEAAPAAAQAGPADAAAVAPASSHGAAAASGAGAAALGVAGPWEQSLHTALGLDVAEMPSVAADTNAERERSGLGIGIGAGRRFRGHAV